MFVHDLTFEEWVSGRFCPTGKCALCGREAFGNSSSCCGPHPWRRGQCQGSYRSLTAEQKKTAYHRWAEENDLFRDIPEEAVLDLSVGSKTAPEARRCLAGKLKQKFREELIQEIRAWKERRSA